MTSWRYRCGKSAAECGAKAQKLRSLRVRDPALAMGPGWLQGLLLNVRGGAVLFSPASRGQLALVISEWKDSKYLGVDPGGQPTENDWSEDVSFPVAPGSLRLFSDGSSMLTFIPAVSASTACIHLYCSCARKWPLRRGRTRTIYQVVARAGAELDLHRIRSVRPGRVCQPEQRRPASVQFWALPVRGIYDRLLLCRDRAGCVRRSATEHDLHGRRGL